MRAILVVSDGTSASDEALRAGGRLAAAGGAGLHVVHCAGLMGMPLREVLPLLESTPPARVAEQLDEQVRRALPANQAARTVRHVEYRAVREGTLHTARTVDARLVVVGLDAGGTAALPALVAAGVPVLVARDAAAAPFERVLVPLNAADVAGSTLRLACAWLRPFEDGAAAVLPELHVLHVSRRLADWRGIGGRFEAEVRAAEEEFRRMGGVFQRHVRWSGAAWPAIVATARELEADLVVLRPGRGAARDDRGGRTWPAVVEQARSNVLLLPGASSPPHPVETAAAARREDGEHRAADKPRVADAELEPVPA